MSVFFAFGGGVIVEIYISGGLFGREDDVAVRVVEAYLGGGVSGDEGESRDGENWE